MFTGNSVDMFLFYNHIFVQFMQFPGSPSDFRSFILNGERLTNSNHSNPERYKVVLNPANLASSISKYNKSMDTCG